MKVYKSVMCRLLPVLMAVFLAAGCGSLSNTEQPGPAATAETEGAEQDAEGTAVAETEGKVQDTESTVAAETESTVQDAEGTEASELQLPLPGLPEAFTLSMVPEYSGDIWADINGDVPFFDERQMEAARRMAGILSEQNGQAGGSYQAYGDLDGLGRCRGACALVGPETLPQEERGQIGMIKPTGWHTMKYDGIDGNYLYNRCHLIGFQLTGQDANEKNLITGTRAMNVEGMLPYEESVLAYVRGTGNHVLYRVTPVFRGDNLLADGVLMEACSVEDPLVRFCAFCYNAQPGIQIDYATGESTGPAFSGNDLSEKNLSEDSFSEKELSEKEPSEKELPEESSASRDGHSENGPGQTGKDETAEDKKIRDDSVPDRSLEETQGGSAIGEWKYIVNVSSMKFHRPGCESVQKMSRKNTQGFNGSREELIEMGYTPCKNCDP